MSINVGQETILVVDDEVQIQRALRVTLSSRGYHMILAATGEDGLDLAAVENPDLVILDLNLPRMSGIEVCRELRSWSEVPIIIFPSRVRKPTK